jgi:hypothetical protein
MIKPHLTKSGLTKYLNTHYATPTQIYCNKFVGLKPKSKRATLRGLVMA